MESNTFLELALEGERLCKSCDFEGGINFFEAAINIGTNDIRTLSAIYSQIGNAYFYLSNYDKALHYHRLDLKLAESMKDIMGEAKASGNLGNTLKMLGRFDEAAIYCNRHFEIARSLNDKIGEGRALYNLGNVYHTMGKHLASSSLQDPGDFPEEVKNCFRKAVEFYEKNLELMLQTGDKLAQGRAFGNLGNSHYLLGNFDQAINYHKERLRIAREFGDKAAERRAHCNLGNAHIFLGDFEKAIHNFKQTLILAQELGDRVIEAQACYSLGNTYTLLRDFKKAIDYHLRHLQIARDLSDKIGEGRAYWSLGNALSSVGNHKEALNYALKHLEISKKLGDKIGLETAAKSISDLKSLLVQKTNSNTPDIIDSAASFIDKFNSIRSNDVLNHIDKVSIKKPTKRVSMEQMDLLKLTPNKAKADFESKNNNNHINHNNTSYHLSQRNKKSFGLEDDYFIDLLARYQGKRMDDQRCVFDPENKENKKPDKSKNSRNNNKKGGPLHRSTSHPVHNENNPNPNVQEHSVQSLRRGSNPSVNVAPSTSQSSTSAIEEAEANNYRDELFDLIEGMNSRRYDDQRVSFPVLRRSMTTTNGPDSLPASTIPENRATNPPPRQPVERPVVQSSRLHPRSRQMSLGANVLPDDDFFDQLMRCQGSRLEDQRSAFPFVPASNGRPPGIRNDVHINGNNNNAQAAIRHNHSRPNQQNRSSTLNDGNSPANNNNNNNNRGATLPDEDFLSLIMRFQSARIEDQRSNLPSVDSRQVNDQDVARSTSSTSSQENSSDFEDGKKCTKV